jgi:hypothetical protein
MHRPLRRVSEVHQMRFVIRIAPLVCLVAGCGFAHKPYIDDPLLRGTRASWILHDEPPLPEVPRAADIEPPPPPDVTLSPRAE